MAHDVEMTPLVDQVALADAAWKELAAGLTERAPFYQERFSAAGIDPSHVASVTDLSALPTMSKADIVATQKESPPFGAHLGVDPDDVKTVYQTSGTSGRPSLVALTGHDKETWTQIGLRSYGTAGVRPDQAVLTTLGAGPFVAGHTHETLDRLGVRRIPVGPGNVEGVVTMLQAGLADTLLSTPTFALALLSRVSSRKLDGPSLGLRCLVLGGEPGGGLPGIRSRLEAAFNATVTEVAGIGDVAPSLWAECETRRGMHFCGQSFVWPELIDPTTENPLAIKPGARGEIVYTTLVREAMPVVRFRSGDIVEVVDTACGCGRTSFTIRIVGRADDMIIVRGVNVFPSAIQAIVADFPQVTGRARVALPDDAGVSVEPPIRVEVAVPPGASAEPGLAKEIANAIRDRLTVRADVNLVPETEFGNVGQKTRGLRRHQSSA